MAVGAVAPGVPTTLATRAALVVGDLGVMALAVAVVALAVAVWAALVVVGVNLMTLGTGSARLLSHRRRYDSLK